jgi:hypothetical protein
LDETAVTPTVPYETVKKWLVENEHIPAEAIREASLVHLPLYVFKYEFEGESYTAVVDAATSKVFANVYPSKWEAPYYGVGVVGCLLYFLAAFIPLVGYSIAEMSGLGLGIVAYLIVVVILAIPLFSAAAYISAKV